MTGPASAWSASSPVRRRLVRTARPGARRTVAAARSCCYAARSGSASRRSLPVVPPVRAGRPHCGLHRPGPDRILTPHPDDDPRNHRLKAQNLAGIWRTYHAAGARHLVMTGPIENQARAPRLCSCAASRNDHDVPSARRARRAEAADHYPRRRRQLAPAGRPAGRTAGKLPVPGRRAGSRITPLNRYLVRAPDYGGRKIQGRT